MLILEYKTYELIYQISEGLEKIFPHIKMKNNTIFASSLLDKRNNPIVRIDSKSPVKALMIKFGTGYVQIKSIVNSTEEKGLANKVMNILFSKVPKDYKFIIDQDVSGGFWDKLIQKYPHYKWEKS